MKILPAGCVIRNERIACTDSTSIGSPSTITISGAPPWANQAPRSTTAHAPRARTCATKSARASAVAYQGAAGSICAARQSACSTRCVPEPSPALRESRLPGLRRHHLLEVGQRIDAAAARRRRLAPLRRSRCRADDDEFARGDRPAVVDEALLVEAGLGVGRIGQGCIDFAVPRRFEHAQGRAGDEFHGDAGIGAEGLPQRARQARFDERTVDAEAQRPERSRCDLGADRRRCDQRQRSGKQGTALHRPIIAAAARRLAGQGRSAGRYTRATRPKASDRRAPCVPWIAGPPRHPASKRLRFRCPDSNGQPTARNA